jgi:D-alanyl-lipoteichoic acid acyltransferase DltB (MBOAT superfamily)
MVSIIFICVSSLFYFKYFNFINESFRKLFSAFNLDYKIGDLNFILPVGISFFTFKIMSYSIDTYRGEIKGKISLPDFSLYVSFFPQILAGPIERAVNLIPQFKKDVSFEYPRVREGLLLFSWGLFKKVVVADRVALVVNNIYSNPSQFQGIPLLVATVLFSYQIYCDFSGYSDMAIGAAKILGYDSMINFKRPYFATNVVEFWRRWHISLSTWFRDYLYIPLGGNRVSLKKWSINILIVFLVSGLWHGAYWTFVVWGGLHGIYLITYRLSKNFKDRFSCYTIPANSSFLNRVLKIGTTYFLVTFAWIFFRANTLSDAQYICLNLLTGTGKFLLRIHDTGYVRSIIGQLGVTQEELIIVIISISILEAIELAQENPNIWSKFSCLPMWLRWAGYYILAILILFFGAYNSVQGFIYLQF